MGVESMRQKDSVTKVEQKPGAAMSRIVQCPKCRVLLQEPPPGNPYYQCGSCSTTLQAKHATKADLESTNLRFHPVDKSNSRSSKSDSSSGEISERVGDDFAYAGADGHRSWSPIRKDATASYARARGGPAAAAPPAPEHFRLSADNARHTSAEKQQPDQQQGGAAAAAARAGYSAMASKHPQPSQQIVNYMVSMSSSEVDMTLLANESASGADYISRRREPRSSAPSPQEPAPAYGSSGFNLPRHPATQAPRIHPASRLNGGRADAEPDAARPPAGANSIMAAGGAGGEMLSLPRQPSGAAAELQRQLSGAALDQLQRQHSGQALDQLQRQLSGAEQGLLNSQSLKSGGGAGESSSSSRSSSGRASKLKWQPRPEPVENAVPSPKAADVVIGGSGSGSRGKFEDDRISSAIAHEDRVKETTSVEYVAERNWRELSSRRRSKEALDQQFIQRTQSDGSEKNFDMYENSAYEASETSSTMDDGDGNDASMGRFSPPPPLQLPDIRGGAPRSQSRPNLPRSRPPSYSEDGNPHATKMPTELDSMDTAHPHADKVNRLNRRQHSWDATRMGAASSSSNLGSPVPASETSASLRKSSSDDYVSMVKEIEHLHSRGSSDPGAVFLQTQQVDASQTQQQQQQQQQNHHQWVARLKPQSSLPRSNASASSPGASGGGGGGVSSPRPPTHGQWSQSGSNLSSYPGESNPLPPSQFAPQAPNQASRQMPDSLPPKREGTYPPLPLPGALPHVECQHCHTILAVPVNLPPPKKSTQKLRCGACMKISTFAVPQAVDSTQAAARPEVLHFGQSLFASSPDAQMEAGYRTTSGRSLSATSDDLRRSGRRFSDLSDKSLPITRNNSIGSADMPSDEELAERVRGLKIDSSPVVVSTSSDAGTPSSYSEVSPSNPDYKSRFGRSPGPLYPKRTSLEHSGSGGRHQTEERSRFADLKGPAPRVPYHEGSVGTSSDDENESGHRNLAHIGSPSMSMEGGHRHTHSNSRSPPPPAHPQSPPMFDPRTSPSGHGIGEHSAKEQQAHEQPKGFKGFKGFSTFKEHLRELTHKGRGASANHSRSRVTVNGEAIPEHVIKKAEEQAGHISPGNYWYDALAGFWGVAGGQCEGIIPAQIEEFQHPMSRNCAGGTTNILVNGRELHSRDLEILARRGLPSIPGRTYRIDIGGRVVNEATGEELRGLGPLAPSVVQRGRGNGMQTR
ncbi:hypothetical protein MPTK1_1g20340 [Marchantia polymorpha subsp. ruderalis]|uniref:Zinc-ribbon domain-containing protein n=4 Tax=Marchantia polymorpha TaxID=3197 RepID=A0AAF6AS88_MARPO|nr:hypothetical protein MARPO_0001s0371 [Marchantia polymorpha]BBM99308.1 hypothetical protein Mp_1g20340 [Marchantia polymorpha subsp. ruderalis]|eukprot:PTQ50391.1 hypothetical protein MARPO_0001s0371 [Marchantia polymorpha]